MLGFHCQAAGCERLAEQARFPRAAFTLREEETRKTVRQCRLADSLLAGQQPGMGQTTAVVGLKQNGLRLTLIEEVGVR